MGELYSTSIYVMEHPWKEKEFVEVLETILNAGLINEGVTRMHISIEP